MLLFPPGVEPSGLVEKTEITRCRIQSLTLLSGTKLTVPCVLFTNFHSDSFFFSVFAFYFFKSALLLCLKSNYDYIYNQIDDFSRDEISLPLMVDGSHDYFSRTRK